MVFRSIVPKMDFIACAFVAKIVGHIFLLKQKLMLTTTIQVIGTSRAHA